VPSANTNRAFSNKLGIELAYSSKSLGALFTLFTCSSASSTEPSARRDAKRVGRTGRGGCIRDYIHSRDPENVPASQYMKGVRSCTQARTV